MSNKKEDSETELSFTDLFKKAFFTGIGAVFMTEEAIRQTLTDLKLPQEMMKGVLKNAQRGKEEVLDIFRNEFHKVLERYDLSKEISKFLESHDVEVKVTFHRK